MISPRTLAAAEVSSAAAAVLGATIAEVAPLPVSYANKTWRAETDTGARYVIKIGPLGSESKWRSAQRAALELAESVGVPVAPLMSSARHEE